MSCCGKKRAEFAGRRTAPAPEVMVETEPARRPASPKIFEYTGTGMLTVTGVVSGTVYRFGHRGARVEVAYEDTFAMMGEREIAVVRGAAGG
jgi:hypothetical protein